MNLNNALGNATSGLTAASRLADTISNNVSNAMTPGFAKRTTELSSLSLGGFGSGVRVAGSGRTENPFLTSERRLMDAQLGATGTRSEAYERMLAAMGEPGSPNSLASRATALETTLMSAVSSPQSMAKLSEAVSAAKGLAGSLNAISAENTRLRTEADGEIARQVGVVNEALRGIDDINKKIVTLNLQGVDVSGLQDERARLIDDIAPIIPVRTVNRENGQVAVYAQSGGVLLDGRVFELKFDKAPSVVTPAQTLAGGGVNPLMQDQGAVGGPVVITTGTGPGLMDGGSLGALFETRDTIVPGFDAEIDRYAADLADRFRTLVPAGSLDGAGEGLFVAADPGLPGLASRIQVNAAVDPAAGGAAWRLRDGLSAAAPGAEGFGAYLQGLSDAMSEARPPAGFISQNAAAGAATIASEIGSFFGGIAARSDDDRAYLAARQSVLSERESSATGVNTDAELQALMLVEQTYAANARVLSVIDELMKLLLR